MRYALVVPILLVAAAPAVGQVSNPQADARPDELQPEYRPLRQQPEPGRVASSSAGEVGQRRTLERTDGIEPLARIDTRIANRVQARLRTRIDRNYDPQFNTTSPFDVAGDQARVAGRSIRR